MLAGASAIPSAMPKPVSGTLCVPPAALSLMVRAAAAEPTAVGAKATPRLQLDPGCTVGQLPVRSNPGPAVALVMVST